MSIGNFLGAMGRDRGSEQIQPEAAKEKSTAHSDQNSALSDKLDQLDQSVKNLTKIISHQTKMQRLDFARVFCYSSPLIMTVFKDGGEYEFLVDPHGGMSLFDKFRRGEGAKLTYSKELKEPLGDEFLPNYSLVGEEEIHEELDAKVCHELSERIHSITGTKPYFHRNEEGEWIVWYSKEEFEDAQDSALE